MTNPSIFQTLQLAVGPVILISAYGLLLLSMTNRLGRAIDRARALVEERRSSHDIQIKIITLRAKWIRFAILFTAIAIFSIALLVLTLFLSAYLKANLTWAISGLFILSLLSLIVSLSYFIADIFASLRAVDSHMKMQLED